jgi:hypothetical protein
MSQTSAIGSNGPSSFYTPQRETSYGKKFMNLGSQLIGGGSGNQIPNSYNEHKPAAAIVLDSYKSSENAPQGVNSRLNQSMGPS